MSNSKSGSKTETKNSDDIYLFVLSPPYQGSTILLKLLSSSPNISTLLGYKNWAGEGQWLLMRSGKIPNYWKNRWDPNYKLNMRRLSEVYHKYWKKKTTSNPNKRIYCEKSPPNICRADRYKRFFEKKGKVYFISLIRDPYCCRYSAREWIKYATFQKKNLNEIPAEQHLTLTYEELCDHTIPTIEKILKFKPELESLNPEITIVKGINKDNQRSQRITNMNRPRNIEKRTKILKNHLPLLETFKYNLRSIQSNQFKSSF